MTAKPHTPNSRHIRKDDYTPSLEQMRDLYVRHADQLGIASGHVLHAEFDRFLTAAEQRGAARGKIEGLREAATSIRDSKFANSVKPPSKKVQVKEADWLDALADRLEADGD